MRIFRRGSALLSLTAAKLIPRMHGIEMLYHAWSQRPSHGLTIRLASCIVMAAYLGNGQGPGIRAQCIEALLVSAFFNHTCIPFLLCHGTWKARCFALAYWLVPTPIRRRLLSRLSKG